MDKELLDFYADLPRNKSAHCSSKTLDEGIKTFYGAAIKDMMNKEHSFFSILKEPYPDYEKPNAY